jgi:DNA-binding beta-propeller fold protein YncE
VGPTGLALDSSTDTLYVASTGDNDVYALSDAITAHTRSGRGTLIYQDHAHLRGPLALALAPNGNLIAANGDAVNADATNTHNSELVEFTTAGVFVDQFQISPTVGGAFGLAIAQSGSNTTLAAVNDILNELEIWTF